MKILEIKELDTDFSLRKNRGLIYQVLYQCADGEFKKFNTWRESTSIKILAGPGSMYFRSEQDLTIFLLKWS